MKTETIKTLKELQLKMPAIIKQYGSDNNLTRLAMANPIIALERVGFTFTPDAKEEIESYVRFGKEGAKRIYDLREKINTTVGRKIDIKNSEQLAEAILGEAREKESAKHQPPAKKSGYRQNHGGQRSATHGECGTHHQEQNQ